MEREWVNRQLENHTSVTAIGIGRISMKKIVLSVSDLAIGGRCLYY